MEAYEAETTEIVTSFRQHEINFPECIEALNAALASFVPKMTGEQIARLRIVLLANNEIVMKEMEKRYAADRTCDGRGQGYFDSSDQTG